MRPYFGHPATRLSSLRTVATTLRELELILLEFCHSRESAVSIAERFAQVAAFHKQHNSVKQ